MLSEKKKIHVFFFVSAVSMALSISRFVRHKENCLNNTQKGLFAAVRQMPQSNAF